MTRSFFGRWLVPGVLAAFALALYLTTLSNVHTFDALSYIRDVDGRTGFFFHPHHLLYSPTGWLFWKSWRLFGYQGNSELALKVLNSLMGAICGFGLYQVVYRLTRQITPSVVATGAFLFTFANWYFSVEVEVYILALFWLLLALVLMLLLVTQPRRWMAPALGFTLGIAALYHQTNGLLVPVIVLAVVLAPMTWRRRIEALVVCGSIAALIVAAGYATVGFGVNRYTSLRQLRDWMFFFVETGWWGHTTHGFWADLRAGLGNTVSSEGPLPYWIGVIVALGLGFSATRRWPRIVLVCITWVLIYAVFFTWWESENIEFWIATLFPLWLLLGLALASIRPQRLSLIVQIVALAGIGMLAWHNYPIIKFRGDAAYDLQRQISAGAKQHSSPEDLILSSGGVMELYLPYYEGRSNVHTLNSTLFETGGNLDQSLERIAADIQTTLHAGLAVLVSEEMIHLPPEIFQRYNVPQSRLDTFWQAYRSAMKPVVTIKDETYFWRIPAADELAHGSGWHWTSFDWGWQTTNIVNSTFDGGWCFDPQSDPNLAGPLINLDASSVHSIEVTLATRAQQQTAQLFYGGVDGALSDEHSVIWKLHGDGKPHTYTIPLQGAPGWQGTIATLRLDPIAVGDGTAASHTCIQQLRFVK